MLRPRPLLILFPLLSLALLLLSANRAVAQTSDPIATGFDTEIRVWTSGANTFVKVRLAFPTTGYGVSDWGHVTRVGNEFVADARVERYNGAAGQAITFKENTYTLGALQAGTYTFTFKSYGTPVKSRQFDPSLVIERWEATTPSADNVYIAIWTWEGITYIRVDFLFPNSGYRVREWGQLTRSGNNFSVDTKVERWTEESPAQTTIIDRNFQLGALTAGDYTITVKVYGTTVETQPFSVSATSAQAPKLLTEENSQRAIALDSVTWMRLFPLETSQNFSSDGRVRILLLATDLELSAGESPSVVNAYAEDAAHRIYPITIEYVGKVPNFDWLTQIIVRPPDELRDGGEIGVNLSVRGMLSNKVLLNIKASTANSQ